MGKDKPVFVECPVCASKPGSPMLCNSCLNNRWAIAKLSGEPVQRGADAPKKKNLMERLEEVLIRNVGNMRSCPNCHHAFIVEDPLQEKTFEVYKELFK